MARSVMIPFKKGAEAYLYREEWFGLKVIRKHRVQKSYRVVQLDSEIRRSRTVREARLMFEACRAGVPTPSIYFVDLDGSTIIMEYLEGEKLKDVVGSLGQDARERIFTIVGQQIGALHKNNIVHGDLTTSNMILTTSGKVFFIDYGLGEFSSSIENKGVDVHLMRRALESTHYENSVECFQSIINGYRAKAGEDLTNEVLKRVREIELRGRYFKRGADNAQKREATPDEVQ